MRLFLQFLVVLILAFACSNPNISSQNQLTEKTNVIIVITDDQGYGDLSCHGHPILKTPNLDSLYYKSTRFLDFHVSPTCAPTRAALLTGHDANRTGVWHTIGGRSLLLEGETTLADVLAKNGYSTGIFGKWHLGDNFPFRPQDRGFQEVLVHGGGGVGQQPDYWNNNYFDDTYFHNGEPEAYQGYCTDIWFDEAINFMEQNRQKGQAFFSYIATNAPHGPFYVSEKYQAPYLNQDQIPNPAFAGMITNVDENIGKLLNYLEDKKIADNTLLIFMTDNGTAAGSRFDKKTGLVTRGYNAGMRNGKGSMYEGGHRVPFFVCWPGNIEANRDITELAAHVDVFPTLIDLLDLQTDRDLKFDGASLKPLLTGEKKKLSDRILITDSQRLETPVKWRQSAVMKGPWRLINGTQLFNINEDPAQQSDISDNHPIIVDSLKVAYEKWWEGLASSLAQVPRIELCPPEEPVTTIHVHDIHMAEGYNSVPWNNILLRGGRKTNGWYAVKVNQPGTYSFNLAYWPTEANAPIRSGVPELPPISGTTIPKIKAGIALPILEAGIEIANQKQTKEVGEKDKKIPFTITLDKGTYELQAWFAEADKKPFAANYVEVKRLKNQE